MDRIRVIRPKRQKLRLTGPVAGWLGVTLFFLAKLHGSELIYTLAASLILGGCMFAFLTLSIRRSALTRDGRSLKYRDTFGRTRVLSGAELPAKVVRATVSSRDERYRGWQIWVKHDGRSWLALMEGAWDLDELDAARTELSIPLETRTEPAPASSLREEFPGSAPWTVAHPVLSGALLVAIIYAVALAI